MIGNNNIEQRISESRHTSCGRQECARRTDGPLYVCNHFSVNSTIWSGDLFVTPLTDYVCITVASSIRLSECCAILSRSDTSRKSKLLLTFCFPMSFAQRSIYFLCAPKRVKLTKKTDTYLPTAERRPRRR